jgi:diketogulonate reductase-like aldo/keto reductase
MIFDETYTLSNGVSIPKLGLGTWMIDDTSVSEAVRQAMSIGYRHIDTAQAYQNEVGVGKGIQSSDVPRADIFVTSKVAAEAKSYEAAAQSITTSLKKWAWTPST